MQAVTAEESPDSPDVLAAQSGAELLQQPNATAQAPSLVGPPSRKVDAKDVSSSSTRENYSEGTAHENLKLAIHEWDMKAGRYHAELSHDKMTMTRFSQIVGIPVETFRKYVGADLGKRRRLGGHVGPSTAVLDADTKQFVVDVLRRRDRANDGMSRQEALDMLQDLQPGRSRSQLATAFDSLRIERKEEITGIVKAQATTTKRSAITVPQQFRWFKVRAAACALPPHGHALMCTTSHSGATPHTNTVNTSRHSSSFRAVV